MTTTQKALLALLCVLVAAGLVWKVLLVDDLLATGGTAIAAAALIEKLGATVSEMAFIVNLPDVGGQKKLEDKGYKIYSQTEFEGD